MAGRGDIKAGSAYVELLLKDKSFAAGLQLAGRKLQAFGKGISVAGGLVTGAFAGAVTLFAQTGAALDDLSKKTGFSAEALSQLKFAAEQSGADIGAVERAARGMEKMLLAAGKGATGATETLEALGVSIEQLKDLTPEQQFQTLADAVAAVQDPTLRAGLAMKAFGKAGSDLLPLFAEGPQGMKALRDEADKLGVTMGQKDVEAAAKFDDAMAALKTQFSAMVTNVGAALAGPLTEFANKAGEIVAVAIDWIKTHQELTLVIAGVGAGVTALGTTLYVVGTALNVMGAAVTGVTTALSFLAAHPVAAAVVAIGATIAYLVNEFYRANDAVTKFDNALAGLDKKRTYGDPTELAAMVQRFGQLADKAKLTNAEQAEARKIIHELRVEYSGLEAFVDTKTGRIAHGEKGKGQLLAAQGGRSSFVQEQEVGLAKQALQTRIAEGADAAEIADRTAAIAKMNEELDRTRRIVADAPALGVPAAAPAIAPPNVQQLAQQAHEATTAAAARRGEAPATAVPVAGGGITKEQFSELLKAVQDGTRMVVLAIEQGGLVLS